MEPQNARGRRTRDGLLEASREIIEAHGPEAATMAAIAERAGVSRRAVYLHFTSRAELLAAMFEYMNTVGEREAAWRPVHEAPDAVAALRATARMMAEFLPRIMPTARALRQAAATDPDAAEHVRVATESRADSYRVVMTRLAGEGRLAAPWTVETAADMMLALSSLDAVGVLLEDRGWSADDFAERYGALLVRTFVAETASDGIRDSNS